MTASIPDDLSGLDMSRITFPSDQISFGDLRRIHPNWFASGDLSREPDLSELDIEGVLAFERMMAQRAYAKAAGLPEPYSSLARSGHFESEEGIAALNTEYKRYGLSSGIHQTRELIRDFEEAAARQGRAKAK